MKTWIQLEAAAQRQGFDLFRTSGCVTVYDGVTALATIMTDQLENDTDADRVVRAALEATLDELERQESGAASQQVPRLRR